MVTTIRYSLINAHYRMQYNFSLETLKGSRTALRRIDDFVYRIQEEAAQVIENTQNMNDQETFTAIQSMKQKFFNAIMDDLNIPMALAALFDGIREIHVLCDQLKMNATQAKEILTLIKSFDSILGIFALKENSEEIPADIMHAFEKRNQARLVKDYAASDQQRDYILGRGYTIEDTKDGLSRIKRFTNTQF